MTTTTSPEQHLDALFSKAANRAFGAHATAGFDPAVRPSKHADYQMNGALGLGKALGKPPREVAAAILEALDDTDGSLAATEIAGPGFVNCTVSAQFLEAALGHMSASANLALQQAQSPGTYVVDYGSPNIAKNMHVGHLRTLIIGDSFVRTLRALGHTVIPQDHQGDWGTQFGMLIEHLVDSGNPEETAAAAVHDLDGLYKAARVRFDGDEEFAQRSRERVVKLQSGDPETLTLWQVLITTSRQYFHEVYEQLGVLLTDDDARGESFYNDMLDETVAMLEEKGLTQTSEGALCVFPKGFNGRDGNPFPFIIRKSDGGYNYATTDLATIRYSVDTLRADELVYVTDVRQAQHFAMVFEVAREAGWLPDHVGAVHIGYGAVLGDDGRPFKTRSGETVQLISLLNEAIERAETALTERTTDLDETERHTIACAVGIGAIKWADLKNENTNNYVFDFDRMLAFNGNTGPYVQYASTRAKSVLRRATISEPTTLMSFDIGDDTEHRLALQLTEFGSIVLRSSSSFQPHQLCAYLFELADKFTSFYEKCPILNAPDNKTRESRLALCNLTARVLDFGLDLLGIQSVDRM